MKRWTFLAGGAATATALASHPARSHYIPSEMHQPFGPNDLAANAARMREQFLEDFDATSIENALPGQHLYRRATLTPDERSQLDKSERSPGRFLGPNQRDLEARPGRRGHRLPHRPGEARTGQSPKENLHVGRGARPISTDVRGQSHAVLRHIAGRQELREGADAADRLT